MRGLAKSRRPRPRPTAVLIIAAAAVGLRPCAGLQTSSTFTLFDGRASASAWLSGVCSKRQQSRTIRRQRAATWNRSRAGGEIGAAGFGRVPLEGIRLGLWGAAHRCCQRGRGGGDTGREYGYSARSRSRGATRGAATAGRLHMAANLYEVLDVPDTAEEKEIKRAYRRKALKTHPDVNESPNAKAEFAEVVNAYEVLSDPKKRQAYDRKRKYTSPFGRGGTGWRAGAGGGAGTSGTRAGGGATWGSATSDRAREEAARRWKEQNPTPDEIDDSFGDILRDLIGGVAGGGRGVVNDLMDFLENRVDGFSSDTSADFEDLMSGTNLGEMEAEVENTRLLLEQLRKRSRKLRTERMAAEREVLAMKASKKRVTDIDELDRQMAVVEKAAGIKARDEEMRGHLQRATARLSRLERKVSELRAAGYSSSSSAYSTPSSRRQSSSSRRQTGNGRQTTGTDEGGSGGRGDRSSGSSAYQSTSGRGGASSRKSTRPPPPGPAGRPTGRRRVDDPAVEAELARLKRDMGL